MTLAEKAQQLSTFTPGTVPGVPRIGLPPYSYHSEGLHGLRNSQNVGRPATLFPQTTAMAASGNMSLVEEMGAVMLREARALANIAERRKLGPFGRGCGLFYWSPTANLCRDPRWGRFQESVSEDPWLNGRYSAAVLRGIQGGEGGYLGVAATCKHLVGYSVEKGRLGFNAIVPVRDLSETYLPIFQRCVVEGRPAQVMCSYNAINGTPACLHGGILNGVLRDQWEFDGLVVSDEDAVKSAFADHHFTKTQANASALALRAGCDLNDGVTYASSIVDAVNAGLVREAEVSKALSRVLTQRFRVGAFDPPEVVPYRSIPESVLDSPQHREVALRAAREAVVLLANPFGALPLPPRAMTVAVIGPMADHPSGQRGGKSDYSPSFVISHWQGIRAQVEKRGGLARLERGCLLDGADVSGFAAAEAAAASSEVTILCVGIDGTIEHEELDRTTIGLPSIQLRLLEAVSSAAKGWVIVILENGGPLSVDWLKPALDNGTVHAVLESFELGQSAGTAVGEVLWGETNPSGILPFSLYPEGYVDQVRMDDMSMRAAGIGRTYRFYVGEPLWAFGHGESYTAWSIEWSQANASTPYFAAAAQAAGFTATRLVFRARVTNTGSVAGRKVVMAYVGGGPVPDGPFKSLFGMAKVSLAAGESTDVSFDATATMAGCPCCTTDWDGSTAVRRGRYLITVGGSGARDGGCAVGVRGCLVTREVHLTGPDHEAPGLASAAHTHSAVFI